MERQTQGSEPLLTPSVGLSIVGTPIRVLTTTLRGASGAPHLQRRNRHLKGGIGGRSGSGLDPLQPDSSFLPDACVRRREREEGASLSSASRTHGQSLTGHHRLQAQRQGCWGGR